MTQRPPSQVILRPILTEKATNLRKSRTYLFEVARDATKPEIKNAVRAAFGVEVDTVRTMIRHGKTRRVRLQLGRTPDTKRAIVTLSEKSRPIDFFEGLA